MSNVKTRSLRLCTPKYNDGKQRWRQTFKAGNYVDHTYDDIGQLKTATGWESDGTTPRLQEQFGYAYDAAWNLNWRTNNQLKQQFIVNNRNQLTTASRSGTLTVFGAASMRKAQGQNDYGVTGVSVSGTGLIVGAAGVYAEGSWARAGAAPVNGQKTYTVTATDNYGPTAQDSVAVYLHAPTSFTYDANVAVWRGAATLRAHRINYG